MEIFNKYKKSLFLILIFFIISLFLIKFSMNLIKSEIINIVNSKKFEVFISNQISDKIQKFANKELSEDEYTFYKENFKKLYLKFEPLFDEIKNELE